MPRIPGQPSLWLAGAGLGLAAALVDLACAREGCLGGGDECVVPTPCERLAFTCEGGRVEVATITRADQLVRGPAALGALGDLRLANDRVVAIIEDLGHPHDLAPSGGNLIDLAPQGGVDSLPHMFQATGLLPGDAVRYDEVRTFAGEDFAAVQLRGHLDGQPNLHVATRYEVRPCEPGVRVRTEIINLGPEPQTWFLADAFYWGGRRNLPFAPGPGRGFEHTSFGLSDIGDAFEDAPYVIAATHLDPSSAYAHVGCDLDDLTGFHGEVITAVGTPRRIVQPRDYEVFERFIGVADAPTVGAGADLALDLRERLFDEPSVLLRGRVEVAGDDPDARLGEVLRASVLVSRGRAGDPPESRVRVTHARPDADGEFRVRVPADAPYVLEVEAYGRKVDEAEVVVGDVDADAGTVSVPAVGELTIEVAIDGAPDHALAILHPADDATDERVRGRMFGRFAECAPLLGHPNGGAPACNRVLVDGSATFAVPPGRYDVYVGAGPFATAARARAVEVAPGPGETLRFELQTLPLRPEGALSADLHVHGAASFDASIPDDARVRSFLAARLDVIAATEHDVVWDYADAIADAGVGDRLRLLPGTETTGHILFKFLPDLPYPQVIGHWNFWPVPFDPTGPWRGAAWDELVEPGMLLTRMQDAGWSATTGVAQMNHPIFSLDFGRDLGWASALGLDASVPLPREFDGTPQSLYMRRPPGADFRNSDYHAQEVMNGTDNAVHLQYRALWFYLLNEGLVRTGTANSDSHSLTDNVIGAPRNLVWADTTLADFDPVAFNAGVREGRALGTNGPVIELRTTDAAGAERTPSRTPFAPAADAKLHITVSAAPWVPVEEVRVVVNGEVVRTLDDELAHPADPLGADGLRRLDLDLDLAPLLPDAGDAWLLVEAGRRLQPSADLDCDGLPDTGDNNGDGKVDWRDVDGRTGPPDSECFSGGPLAKPPDPEDRDSPAYLFWALVPGGSPTAFTNPLILDRDGGGYAGVNR